MYSETVPTATRPLALIGLILSGVFLAILLGALTNAVNGAVSPLYFVKILRWEALLDVRSAAIAQGMFEGALSGLVLSVAFATAVGIISRAACPFRTAAIYLLGIVAGALVCWILGGLFAMGLAALSPAFYHGLVRAAPDGTGELLRFAWVGGSITGVQLGGIIGLIVACVLFRARWRASAALPVVDSIAAGI